MGKEQMKSYLDGVFGAERDFSGEKRTGVNSVNEGVDITDEDNNYENF